MRRRLFLLVCALAAAGCVRPRPVETYFPLGVGHRWTYSMLGPEAGKELVIQIVGEETAQDGARYLLDAGGEHYYLRKGETVSLSISPGIWTILLEGPLTIGRRFDGGRSEGVVGNTLGEAAAVNDPRIRPIPASGYKIVGGFDRRVTVPAGTFKDCLEVIHVAGALIGLKLYAPGVGLVFSEAWVTREGKRTVMSRQELTSFEVDSRGENPPARLGGPK